MASSTTRLPMYRETSKERYRIIYCFLRLPTQRDRQWLFNRQTGCEALCKLKRPKVIHSDAFLFNIILTIFCLLPFLSFPTSCEYLMRMFIPLWLEIKKKNLLTFKYTYHQASVCHFKVATVGMYIVLSFYMFHPKYLVDHNKETNYM